MAGCVAEPSAIRTLHPTRARARASRSEPLPSSIRPSGRAESHMQTRTLGSLAVSVVGLGCNNFGGRLDQEATTAVVNAALDAGINFFDTADVYGGTHSEEFIGRALGARRRSVIVATKFGIPLDEQRKGGAQPEYIRRALDDSLK